MITDMAAHYEHEIPESYEARIEGNKVIFESKESEDEKIRKDIYGFLNKVLKDKNVLLLIADRIGDDVPNMIPGWISYLEKQKEQKPNIELIQRSWYMEGYTDGKFKREPMWNLVTGKGGPRYEKNEKYGQPLEQKQKAIRITGSFVDGSYKFDVVDMPKPAEWSEEDERLLNIIIDILDREEHNGHLMRGDLKACVKLLKSLRSQTKQEWSEEDSRILYNVIAYVGYAAGQRGVRDDEFKEANAWLKSLRPQPHWKLSEEQMKYLAKAIKTLGEEGDGKTAAVLNELRCDLKKL